MRLLSLFLMLFFVSLRVYGEVEQYYNSLLGSEISVGASMMVTESYYGINNGTLYDVESSVGVVKLRHDYASHSLFLPSPFVPGALQLPVIEVTVDIIWTDISGGVHQIEDEVLEIEVASVATDLVRIEGAHRLEVQVKGVSSGVLTLQAGMHVFLESEIEVHRHFRLPGSDAQHPLTAIAGSDYELSLSVSDGSVGDFRWQYQIGAAYYELEWVVLDDAFGLVSDNLGNREVDFSRASRLQVKEANYRLSLAYARSVLAYRVRAVYLSGPQGMGEKHYAVWSTDGLVSVGENRFELNQGGVEYHQNYAGLDLDRNWSFVRSYAEWGKSKEVIQYADGTSRVRQVVTRLSTEDETLVGETMYDFEGRPVVEFAPVPSGQSTLEFHEAFNLNGNQEVFGPEDFDVPVNGEAYHQPTVWTGSGAGQYYSSQNPFLSGLPPALQGRDYEQHFLPDAEGLPYRRTMYTDDGTGRVKMTSGLGGTHQITSPEDLSGHQTTYYYSSTNEGELRRLFGTEVGDASQYVKELVKDANGQISVAYKRVDGKVVATGLSGEAPDNLAAIAQPEEEISFLAEIQPPSGTAEEDVQSIAIPFTQATPQLYHFSYGLSGGEFDDCSNFCADCSYELSFTLYDPEGDVVNLNVTQPGSGTGVPLGSTPGISFVLAPGTLCDPAILDGLAPLEFDVLLDMVGNYSLIRTLRLHEPTVEQAIAAYALHYPANCAPSISGTVNLSDCDAACLSAAEAAMAVANPPIAPADQADWLIQWMFENCFDVDETIPDPIGSPVGQTPCEGDCAQLLSVLELDVSPGGQYYLDDQWLLDHMSSWNLLGMTNVSPSDFRTAFDNLSPTGQQGAIDVMVESHPEYCHYEWCILPLLQASCSFDHWLEQTVDASNFQGPLVYNGSPVVVHDPLGSDPDRIPLTDPFFDIGGSGYAQLGTMEDRLADYPTGNDPLNPANGTVIEVIEDQLADPTDTDGEIDTWAEMEMFLDIYLSLKAGIIADLKAAATPTACGYVYPSGNSPSYLDGKQIRVMDPTVSGLLTGGGSIPTGSYPVLGGDLAGMCEQNCDTWAQEWRQQLSNCIQWQDSFKDDNPPTYNGSSIFLGGYELGYYSQASWPLDGGGSQTLIDWVVNGGVYNGTTIVGLREQCQTHCEGPPSDLSGCLASSDVDASLLAVFTTLLGVDLTQLIPGESDSWLTVMQDCFQPAMCVDHPFGCDCGMFDLATHPLYSDLDGFLSHYGIVDPVPPTSYTSYTTIDGYLIDEPQLQTWYNACVAGTLLQSDLPLALRCHAWDLGEEEDNPCENYLDFINTFNIEQLTASDFADAMSDFGSNYHTSCWEVSENLLISYQLKEYHYTLYYYDQSGNLVQTVPPEGVEVLSAAEVFTVRSTCVAQGLSGNDCAANPEHSYLTRYQQDSYNVVVGSRTPDGGQSVYVYDELGRERFSQNAQQATQDSWSYTRYDHLSRKVEVGEFFPTDPQADLEPENANFPDYIHGERRDITYTWYGVNNVEITGLNMLDDFVDAGTGLLVPTSVLPLDNSLNLRNRIGISARIHSIREVGSAPLVDLGQSTHYVYDVAGNVKELHQVNRDMINLLGFGVLDPNMSPYEDLAKVMHYEYDLVSGNVNAFHYQPSQLDQYHHRYRYDADNRLTHVFTSLDGVIWDQDARYDYYPHGPLARVELGQDLIQGRDSYYTLQGWLKGINSAGLDPANDPGRDGLTVGKYDLPNYHTHFAKDAMGFQLNYYDNANEKDYRPIAASGQVGLPMLAVNGNLASARHDLYNGNIGSMFTGIQDEPSANPPGIVGHGLSGSAYQYDQLNRIVQSQFFDNYNPTSDNWDANAGNHQHYQTSYSYDSNGNLDTLKRSGNLAPNGNFDMDILTYTYEPGNNRLSLVEDDPALTANYATDIDGTTTFGYDLIGRLISHPEEQITAIEWDPYQKIKEITFDQVTAPQKPQNLQFFYDGMGNRTVKAAFYESAAEVADRDVRHTWHVHDASGNVVATYQAAQTYQATEGWHILNMRQSEVPLYGSSRLGMHQIDRLIRRYYNDSHFNGYHLVDASVPTLATGTITSHQREVGHKAYELTNHLGNVIATVSDRKWPVFSEPKPGKWQFEHFQAELLSASEYYPAVYPAQAGGWKCRAGLLRVSPIAMGSMGWRRMMRSRGRAIVLTLGPECMIRGSDDG